MPESFVVIFKNAVCSDNRRNEIQDAIAGAMVCEAKGVSALYNMYLAHKNAPDPTSEFNQNAQKSIRRALEHFDYSPTLARDAKFSFIFKREPE